MPSLRFEVLGTPVPQGSKNAFVVGGRAVVTEAGGAAWAQWRHDVMLAAHLAWSGVPASEAAAVTLHFFFARPKSVRRDAFKTTRPDLDKLVRSVLDGLVKGGVLADDSLVTELTACKAYATPGAYPRCEVEVEW